MRKANSVCAAVVYVFFALHEVLGSLELLGILPFGSAPYTLLYVFTAILVAHMAMSGLLVLKEKRQVKKGSGPMPAKGTYAALTRQTTARRASGLSVLILVCLHIAINALCNTGVLPFSQGMELANVASVFLLVVELFVHLSISVKPLFVGLGIDAPSAAVTATRVVLVGITLFAIVACIVFTGRLL